MNVLCVDPGETHVGWAYFSDGGELRKTGTVTPQEAKEVFRDDLREEGTGLVIIEAYRTRARGHNVNSEGRTAQLIGILRAFAEEHGVEVRMQEPACKNVAYKCPWREILSTVKNRHARDAAAHGVYYFGFERKIYGKPV